MTATEPGSTGQRAVIARDAGLRRISRATRWLVAGAAALSGALALIASHSGHTSSGSSASTASPAASKSATSNTSGTTAAGGSGTTAAGGGLAPAQSAPTSSSSAPVAVSGGS
jgi:hypothetical protein